MSTLQQAQQMLATADAAVLAPLWTQLDSRFGLDDAYAVADAVRQARMARGERPRGYKIGFTNRTLWPKYGVHAPIWGVVWDSTLSQLDGAQAEVALDGLVQPRLEPEIMFGFRAAPQAGMDERALAGCIDWVAHGFEIVHTHFEQWRFTAADAVADGALHGRLIVGPRVPIGRFQSPMRELAALTLELWCDDVCVDRGDGAVVLDGPLTALRLWLEAMRAQPHGWSVGAGDVVTTGTLTDAWPLQAGQVWHTRIVADRLPGLRLDIARRAVARVG